jgi:peptide deformylase
MRLGQIGQVQVSRAENIGNLFDIILFGGYHADRNLEQGETMGVREVLYIDDDRLRRKARKVTSFTPELKQLAGDMLETMRHYNGVGLAGPQIGVMQRIFVAEIPEPDDDEGESHPQSGEVYTLVNPKIIKSSAETEPAEEGCLSIPGWQGIVERPAWVQIQAQDVTGRRIKLKVDALLARIFQHEMDHLDGVLFTDHITDPQKLWQLSEKETDQQPLPAELVLQPAPQAE